MLLLVPVIGVEVRNTRRWIDLGAFQFQPSEFGKLLLVLFLAAFLADRGQAHRRREDGARPRRASRCVPMRARLPRSRTSGRRSSTRRLCRRDALHRGHALGPPGGAARAWRSLVAAVVLWLGAGGQDVQILKPTTSTTASRASRTPRRTRRDRRYNITQSIDRRRRGRADGRGVAGATQTKRELPPRASRPTSSSPRSPSSAGSSEPRSCCSSTCS